MAEIFNLQFPSDLSEFTSTVTDGGDLAWNSGTLGGVAGRVGVTIDDATAIYGTKTFTALGATPTSCGFRFYIADLGALTMANQDLFAMARIGEPASDRVFIARYDDGGTDILTVQVRDDNDTFQSAVLNNLGSTTYVEITVNKASSAVANDGTVNIKFDGVAQTGLTGLDFYTKFELIDRVAIGARGDLDAGTSGTYYFGQMVFRNDNTEIGALGADPVITIPSAQTGVVGTQLSVTGISVADTDTNLATIQVLHSGAGTCTLTLSGTTVTAGSLGSGDFTISGTQANLNTAIGTLKADHAEAWPTRSFSTTITITATDSLSASDQETIAVSWGIRTGVGTRAIKLTGTHAQIIAALPTIQWTPATDFVGSINCLMYSVTSTPLTDTDTFTINVTSLGGSVPSGSLVFKKDFTKYNTATRTGRRER